VLCPSCPSPSPLHASIHFPIYQQLYPLPYQLLREAEKVKNEDEKKLTALTHSKYALLKNEADLNELQK
jgi:hypothetical protein